MNLQISAFMFSDLPVLIWMLQAFDLVHLFLSAEPFVVKFYLFFKETDKYNLHFYFKGLFC